MEGVTTGPRDFGFDPQLVRQAFAGPYLGNNGYTRELALQARRDGLLDLVGFGRPFISNPDLVARLQNGWPVASDDRETYYGRGMAGYTDYPSFEEVGAPWPEVIGSPEIGSGLEVCLLDVAMAARFNVLDGWWIMAAGAPYVGAFTDERAVRARFHELSVAKPVS